MNEKYSLDVAGFLFFTTKTTLFRSPLLKSMIEQKEREDSEKEDPSPLFVDRDPFVFHHILNYLRSYKLCGVQKEDSVLLDQLRCEASFFRLPDLVSLVDSLLVLDHPSKKESD